MRIKVRANELVDGEIDFVSLVKHGANRMPWKIVKMEDLPEAGTFDNLKDKLNVMFGKEAPQVAAFFVKKGEESKYEVILKDAGFDTSNSQALGTVTMYKQECFDEEADVSMVAIDCNMGLAFDRIVKEFSSYPMSADFTENMGASAFFPGLHHSMEALGESIWNALNVAENLDDAAGMIDKNLKAFRTHVNALVKNMPASVIKMELKGLANGIGGRTLISDTDGEVAKTGDRKMKITEAMAGDLAGLNDTEAQDQAALAKADAQAEQAADAVVVFLDADGNEISEEEFEKMCGGKKKGDMKKGKMKKGDDEVEFFQIVAEEDVAKEDDGKTTEAATDEDVEKGDVLGQGEGAFAHKSPGSDVVSSTSDTGAVSRDEGLPSGYRTMQKSVKKFEDGKLVDAIAKFLVNEETGEEVFVEYVEKEETQEEQPQVTVAALDLIGKGINDLAGKLDAMNERLEKQDEKIEALQKSNEEVIEKTESVTLVDTGYDLDESFGILKHEIPDMEVQKSDDLWAGLSPELDALEARLRSGQ